MEPRYVGILQANAMTYSPQQDRPPDETYNCSSLLQMPLDQLHVWRSLTPKLLTRFRVPQSSARMMRCLPQCFATQSS